MAVSTYVQERLAIALANADMAHELITRINAGGGGGGSDGAVGYVQTSDGSGGFVGVSALAIAHGGTGATSAVAARTNLGLAIGSDVQAAGAYLTSPIAESDVTGLVAGLAAKAPLASPTFTGTPVGPTAANGTNTTQLATTAFVLANAGAGTVTTVFTRSGDVIATTGDYSVAQVTGAAPLASPTFTGTPAAPTAATATSTTQLATCAFVQANITALALGTASTHPASDFQPAGAYLTGNQTIALSGDVSGSGATAITTTIGAAKVTNAMLAGSITASNLVGTDIATVGSVTAGAWLATTIAIAHGGTGATTANAGLNALLPAQGSNSGKYLTTDGSNSSWAAVGGGSPGGSSGAIQYNNGGSFDGFASYDGNSLVLSAGTLAHPALLLATMGVANLTGSDLTFIYNSTYKMFAMTGYGLGIAADSYLNFSSTANNPNATPDTGLYRASAGVLRVTTGTTSYGTLTAGAVQTLAGTSTHLAKVGGAIFDHYTDAGNTSTTETDLYSDTLDANIFAANGDKVTAEYGGIFVSSATATRQVKLYFAGTVVLDTGALTLTLSSAWTMYATFTRVSSTVVRYMVSLTTEGAALAAYTAVGELTGLTLSGTNVLKVTGQAAGTGAATNDIVAKIGTVLWSPAA